MENNIPNLNILNNISRYVKQELDANNIPEDAKIALVGTVDHNGARIVAAVQILRTQKFGMEVNAKVAAVFEQEWDGDRTAGMKLIFVGK